MFRKLKKRYKNFIKKKFLITDIEGDSLEYEIFDLSVKRLNNPIGSSFEIGVRRGMGSKLIIDSFRKYHPHLNEHIHIGLDPYGELPYNFSEERKSILNHDYTNLMKREMMINFSKKYKEFHFVNLDTNEFFKRFHDGYPIYSKVKKIVDKFEIVHFDGLHDFKNVSSEIDYFLNHLCEQTIFILDDIDTFDFDRIKEKLIKYNFKLIEYGKRKASFEYLR